MMTVYFNRRRTFGTGLRALVFMLLASIGTGLPTLSVANDYQPGSMTLYTAHNNPDECTFDFVTRSMVYHGDRLPECQHIYSPDGFRLKDARSATRLVFKQYKNSGQTCKAEDGPNDGPYRWYIEMKTVQQPTNTGTDQLNINRTMAAAKDDELVHPGLLVLKTIRDADVEPGFDYSWHISCFSIKSSD